MNDPSPTRPADLFFASTRVLLDAWHRHTGHLVNARHGTGEVLRPARLACHALDALATGQAIADQMAAARWTNALDALTYGATLDHVAAAMGLEIDEVAAGMRGWADGQQRIGSMTPAQCDEVYALAGREASR